MKITRFEDIEAWQEARKLNRALSQLTRTGQWFQDLFLADQIRRCAVSGMANISEGFEAGSRREFIRFLRISSRSMSELQSHLYVALDAGLMTQATFSAFFEQARATRALAGGFIGYLKSKIKEQGS